MGTKIIIFGLRVNVSFDLIVDSNFFRQFYKGNNEYKYLL